MDSLEFQRLTSVLDEESFLEVKALLRLTTRPLLNMLLILGCVLLSAVVAMADTGPTAPSNGFAAMGLKSPKAILEKSNTGFFSGRFSGKVVEIDKASDADKKVEKKETANTTAAQIASVESDSKTKAEIAQNVKRKILNRVDKDAPESFQNMVYSYRTGNSDGAKRGATGYVDYLTNLMFELRVYTQLIGEAFIEREMIEEDEWVGVEQLLNWTMASSRSEGGNPLKMTHQAAMKRIVPDANHQVEVYYFFSLSSKYSREMAPDVERLWRAVKNDKNVKMTAVSMGAVPSAWMQSYREYTGLTIPIFNGEQLAKKFKIALVPAVVVVSKTSNTAYLKTGQQDFKRLYEFVRTAQGLPTTLTPALQRLANAPIGSLQSGQKVKVAGVGNISSAKARNVRRPAKLEKF